MLRFAILAVILLLCEIGEFKKFASKTKDKLSLLKEKKPIVKLVSKPKADKVKTEMSMIEEDFEEGDRICLAIKQEGLEDFFIKFGLVSKLIDDVGSFKEQMKRSFSSQGLERKKRYRLEELGQMKSGDKYFIKSKVGLQAKPIKHNYLQKARSDPNYMPPCYGFNYLTALDALIENEDGKLGPDMDTIEELVAEMRDRKLSSEIVHIFKQCDKTTQSDKFSCPEVDTEAILKEKKRKHPRCPDNCVTNNECATKEICCPNVCGGNTCFNPRLLSKFRSEEQKLAISKCQDADRFLQCVYARVKGWPRCFN